MSSSRMLVLVAAALMAARPSPPVARSSTGRSPGAPPGAGVARARRDHPFFSTWLDLAASGYVEEEFYVSGVADA